jgi:lambda repressor-like predicted transcriptional regulator
MQLKDNMKESIKKELDERGWSILKLAKETGIRYPSLSEYFAGRKELNSKNIEIVLNTLDLKTMKKSGSRIPEYNELLSKFTGTEMPSGKMVTSDDFAAYLLGVLISKASRILAKELRYEMNYGDVYEKFIAKEIIDGKQCLDIRKSVQKRDFVRIADEHFFPLERNAFALLVIHEYSKDCEREYLEQQFLSGLFSTSKLPDSASYNGC